MFSEKLWVFSHVLLLSGAYGQPFLTSQCILAILYITSSKQLRILTFQRALGVVPFANLLHVSLRLVNKTWYLFAIQCVWVSFFPGKDIAMAGQIDHELLAEAETAWTQREWSIQHVLFPAMRLFLKPPTSMATNGTFVQVFMFTWISYAE